MLFWDGDLPFIHFCLSFFISSVFSLFIYIYSLPLQALNDYKTFPFSNFSLKSLFSPLFLEIDPRFYGPCLVTSRFQISPNWWGANYLLSQKKNKRSRNRTWGYRWSWSLQVRAMGLTRYVILYILAYIYAWTIY